MCRKTCCVVLKTTWPIADTSKISDVVIIKDSMRRDAACERLARFLPVRECLCTMRVGKQKSVPAAARMALFCLCHGKSSF